MRTVVVFLDNSIAFAILALLHCIVLVLLRHIAFNKSRKSCNLGGIILLEKLLSKKK